MTAFSLARLTMADEELEMRSDEPSEKLSDERMLRLRAGIKAYLNSPLDARHLAASAAMAAFPNPPKPFIRQEPLYRTDED